MSFSIDRLNFDYSLEHYIKAQEHLDSLNHDLLVVTNFYVENYIYEQINNIENMIKQGFSKVYVENNENNTHIKYVPCTYIEMLEPEEIKEHNLKIIGLME